MSLPYRLRFVGATHLPRSLSEADVDEQFSLSNDDIAEIRARFAQNHRLAAALQYVVLRATGRHLDQKATPPRTLMRNLQNALGVNALSIASLRTLYRRRATLFDHQEWASQRSSFANPADADFESLSTALDAWAKGAASVDDLVGESERWLFENKCVIPSDRRIRDLARSAFADTESAALQAIKAELSTPTIRKLLAALYAKRANRQDETVFEWLKTATAKHSPSNLNEVIAKIDYLKGLGVATWSFPAISNACLRAYAQQCANRRASFLRQLTFDSQTLEIACFLRATLLDLTDASLYMAARRVNDLYRQAASRVTKRQTQQARELREREQVIRNIVHAEDQTAAQKIDALKALLPEGASSQTESHAASVRRALAEDSTRVGSLLNAFQTLTVQGEVDHKALRQIELLRDLEAQSAKQLPPNVDPKLAEAAWHRLLDDDDRVLALGALKACALTGIRKGLRSGRLWIDHSWSYRRQDTLLIPQEEWRMKRSSLVSALGLTLDPKKFLQRLRSHLDAGLQALSEAVNAGSVEIDEQGRVRLPALAPRVVEPDATRTRNAMFALIGSTQFCDMIVEIDSHVGFSHALLGHRAKSEAELVACYGALLAHGTENDAKGVAAMLPGVEPTHISGAMRDLEARGRLRRANDMVVAFQRRHAISTLWGQGDKASADMMALDASRHLYNARVDPRRRTFAVGLYTHVLDAYGVIYDQPIVLNERQAAAAVEGVEQYNMNREDAVRLSLLAVDTHGYTYAAMTIAKLLGFDLCPRLSDLTERRLYISRGMVVPENLEAIALSQVSEAAIVKGWDELLRLVASIRSGRLTAKDALERLGRGDRDIRAKSSGQMQGFTRSSGTASSRSDVDVAGGVQ